MTLSDSRTLMVLREIGMSHRPLWLDAARLRNHVAVLVILVLFAFLAITIYALGET